MQVKGPEAREGWCGGSVLWPGFWFLVGMQIMKLSMHGQCSRNILTLCAVRQLVPKRSCCSQPRPHPNMCQAEQHMPTQSKVEGLPQTSI